ncbi:MAG: DNA primase, partial [Muribaculaceae bacterium]|nr:DNA primase [Muribaculaceae bacterium]
HEQMTYWEALRYLARKYHIEIQEHEVTDAERQEMNERQGMMEANDFAMKHFERNMTDTPDVVNIGLAYFRERGINDWAVKRFHLGYSIDRRDDLLEAAKKAGINEKYLVDTGLCVKTERGMIYDRFKARVMYPVFTISGKVVAFGGRTLRTDKEVAKYVNSPESLIYSKSRELYGLYQAKQAIVKKDKCILVEGYMDVISMHQQGVENVVASSGTSLTHGQIRLIHRFTENVTVIYDSDPAGIKASLRGIDLLLAEGLNIKVLLLPEGDDPDSFAQSHSAAEVEEYLACNEVDFIKFKMDILLKDCEDDPVKRSKVLGSILQSIANIPVEITRSFYIKECSLKFGVDERVLLRQLNVDRAKLIETNAKLAARQNAAGTLPPASANADGAELSGGGVPNGDAGIRAGESTATAVETQPVVAAVSNNPHASVLAPQERALLRILLKYGMVDLGEDFGCSENGNPVKVIDYISEDLEVDNMHFSN